MAQITGTSDNDFLTGTAEADQILGLIGNDTLQGLDANDTLNGGQDDDFLLGGLNNDEMFGDVDNDTLQGESGEDLLYGNTENDVLSGGEGDDILYGGQGDDTILGDSGNNELLGDKGNDVLYSGIGSQTLTGGAGSDIFVLGRNLRDDEVDTIVDFRSGFDLIGLLDNLTFADLKFVQKGNDTVIEDLQNGRLLITLKETNAETLNNAANFTQSIQSLTPIVNFTSQSQQIQEGQTTELQVEVQRSGSPFDRVSATIGLDTNSTNIQFEPVSVTFQPYETVKQVTVTLSTPDDEEVEGSNVLNLRLENLTEGATLGNPQTLPITLVDNDFLPSPPSPPSPSVPPIPTFPVLPTSTVTVSASSPDINEDSSESIVYTFTRTADSLNLPVSVNFSVAGDAQFDRDYILTGATSFDGTQGSINFGSDVSTVELTLTPVDNSTFEEDRALDLTINPTGFLYVAGEPNTASVTITNDDLPPKPTYNFSTANVVVMEGEPNSPQVAEIRVERSGDIESESTVDVVLSSSETNGATPGVDFNDAPITVVFAAGETQKTIQIPLIPDNQAESPEIIDLSFANFTPDGQGGTENSVATITINDDDGPIVYGFSEAMFDVLEGQQTAQTNVIEVNRSGNIAVESSVVVNLTGVNAVPGTDFSPQQVTLNFSAGEMTQTVPVTIFGNDIRNDNKTVQLSLETSNGEQVSPLNPTADLIIVDDDKAPTFDFSSSSYQVTERNTDFTSKVVTVVRSGNTTASATVEVVLTPSETNGATADTDFSPTSFLLEFAPGETTKTLPISIGGDVDAEENETVALSLTNFGDNGQLGETHPTATLTIKDNDAPPTYNFSEAEYTAEEGEDTRITRIVQIERSGDISQASAVDVVLTGDTATPGSDFTAGPVLIEFQPNETTKRVPIEIIGNELVGPDVTIDLSFANFSPNGQGGTEQPTATFTIEDDDTATLKLATTEPLAIEPSPDNEEAQPGIFEISRDPDNFGDLTVNLNVAPLKMKPEDYALTTASGEAIRVNEDLTTTVTIPDGQATLEIFLNPVDDIQAEADESLTLELAPGDYEINSQENSATVTISAHDTIVTQLGDTISTEEDAYLEFGEGSLRQALLNAQLLPGEDTISFAEDITSGVINLTGALPSINDDLVIAGLGADQLTIQRDTGGDYSLFTIDGGTVTLQGLTLTNGRAQGTLDNVNNTLTGSRGGAVNIRSTFATVNIENSYITANEANIGGAIANSGILNVLNSTISNNIGTFGGGIFAIDGLVNMTNSTIAQNQAQGGGGLYNSVATITATNATIAGNVAEESGGGVRNVGGVVNLKNTLVAQNTAENGPDILAAEDFAINSGGNNLIGDGSGASGFGEDEKKNTDLVGTSTDPIDPLFSSADPDTLLQDNGGPMPTIAIEANSPAVDAGNKLFATPYINPRPFDQRGEGFNRIVNAVIDIGAFENQF